MSYQEHFPLWVFAIYFLIFITVGVGWYLDSRKGWLDFAETFRVKKLPKGKRFGLLSGRFSLQMSYNNVLIASIAPEGFGLSIPFPFRVFHPPLLIPWSNVTIAETQTILSRRLNITLTGSNRQFTVSLPIKAQESLEKYCRIGERRESVNMWPAIGILALLWLILVLGFVTFGIQQINNSMPTDPILGQLEKLVRIGIISIIPPTLVVLLIALKVPLPWFGCANR